MTSWRQGLQRCRSLGAGPWGWGTPLWPCSPGGDGGSGLPSRVLLTRLLLQIPPLGKHYSQRWAQEDLLEEQKDGARVAAAADKKKGVLGPLTELDTKGASGSALHPGSWAQGHLVRGTVWFSQAWGAQMTFGLRGPAQHVGTLLCSLPGHALRGGRWGEAWDQEPQVGGGFPRCSAGSGAHLPNAAHSPLPVSLQMWTHC